TLSGELSRRRHEVREHAGDPTAANADASAGESSPVMVTCVGLDSPTAALVPPPKLHHMIPVSLRPELEFDDDDAVSVCQPCHALLTAQERLAHDRPFRWESY